MLALTGHLLVAVSSAYFLHSNATNRWHQDRTDLSWMKTENYSVRYLFFSLSWGLGFNRQ